MRTFKAGMMLWGGYMVKEWLGNRYVDFDHSTLEFTSIILTIGFVFCVWNDLADAIREQRN